jgi:hypothetical protein
MLSPLAEESAFVVEFYFLPRRLAMPREATGEINER